MARIGVFHNGGTSLRPKRTATGEVIPDASIEEMHADRKQTVLDRVEYGVFAEQLGYDQVVFSEHHSVVTGAEFSPNPVLTQTAIAAQTSDIKLVQMANILPWHEPIRLAEQLAMLDIISGGRVEVGIGRGYQPRESEVLGDYWGGTIQDSEKNRASLQEKYEILIKAWTEGLFSYHGNYHYIPPKHTVWHHRQDYEYLADDVTEYDVEDMLEWYEGSASEDELNAVLAGRSKLRSVAVFPQPLQEPHPQLWQPVTSQRSMEFAAKRGINAYMVAPTSDLIKGLLEGFYTEVEAAGWPDRRPEYDGEPFAFGWDEARGRGVGMKLDLFNPAAASEDAFERWKRGIEMMWSYYGRFGNTSRALDADRVTHDGRPKDVYALDEKDLVIIGDSDEILDRIMGIAESNGFEDLCADIKFEMAFLTQEETKEQMAAFAEDVLPYLREAFQ